MNEIVNPYEALNFDGLERRANYRVIAFREDILIAFERRDAAAILYNIIYRWLEVRREELLKETERRKKAGLPPMSDEEVEHRMWVYMSYNDFVRESGGAVGYNTVIRTLGYLTGLGAFEQRENHDPRFPDYEYRINKQVMIKLLKALPATPAFTPKVPKKKASSTQMGTGTNQSTQMGTASTHKGISTTQMGTEVYPNGGTSQYPTSSTSFSHDEESTDASAIAPAAPTPFSSQQQQAEPIHIASSEQEDNEKVGQNEHTDLASHSSHHQHSAEPHRHRIENVGLGAQPQGVTDENNSHSHGEVTQANSVGVVPHGRAKAVPPEEQKTPPKPRRTPPVHKDGVPTAERIEQVFVCMEGTIRRLTEQEDFTFGRTKKAKEAIKDLLQGRTVSQEKMDWHIVRLWHKPKDTKSGFWWRENMSVVAICNNYDREIVNYKPPRKVGASTVPEKTVSGKPRFEVPDDILEAMTATGGY